MDYLYQHRWTFWNIAKLKTVHTDWFDSNDPPNSLDINFELDISPVLEDWLCAELGCDCDTVIENGHYRLESRVPRYDDLIEEAAE